MSISGLSDESIKFFAEMLGDDTDPLKLRQADELAETKVRNRVKDGVSLERAIISVEKDIVKMSETYTKRLADPYTQKSKTLEKLFKLQEKIGTSGLKRAFTVTDRQIADAKQLQLEAIRQSDRIIQNRETPDPDFGAQVLAAAGLAEGTSSSLPRAIIQNYMNPNIFAGDPRGFRGRDNWFATFKSMLDEFEQEAPGTFKFNADNTIANVEELSQAGSGLKNNPLYDSARFDDATVKKFASDLNLYNQKVTRHNQQKAELQQRYENNEALGRLAASPMSIQEKTAQFREMFGSESDMLDSFYQEEAKGMPAEVRSQYEKELSETRGAITSLKDSRERLKAQRSGGVESSSRSIQMSARARAFSNPAFVAWARDNGFDQLGYVSRGQYVEGSDDDRAIIRFNKQRRLDSGKFGFRKAKTGEQIQVELKDGTRVVGERLKRHAADRGGILRIDTEDGVKTFPPSSINLVRVFPPGGLVLRDLGEMIGTAVTPQGDYALKDGSYVKQSDFDVAAKKLMSDNAITLRMVDSERYGSAVFAIDGQDKVYQLDGDGTLHDVDISKLKGDAAKQASVMIQLAEQAKPLRISSLEGEESRLLTMNDIKGGKLPFEEDGTPLWELEGTDEEDAARYDVLSQQFRNSITPEDLGFTSTSERPDPFKGQKISRTRDIAGIKFVDLAEDQGDPEGELPEDPTAREQADADELTDLAAQRETADVIFGGEEGRRNAESFARAKAAVDKLSDVDLKLEEGQEDSLADTLSSAVGDPRLKYESIVEAAQVPYEQPTIDVDQLNKEGEAAAKGVRRKTRQVKRQKFFDAVREKFPRSTEVPEEDASSGDPVGDPDDFGDVTGRPADMVSSEATTPESGFAPGASGLPDSVADTLIAKRMESMA